MGAPSTLQRAELLRALTLAGVQVDLTATIGVNQERALHVLLHGKDPVGTTVRPLNAVTQGTGATLLIAGESSNLQQDPGNFALEVVLKTAGAFGVSIDPRDRNWVLNLSTDSVQVAGDQFASLLQRPGTFDLFTALRAAGIELVGQSDNADAVAVETIANILKVASRLYGFNGTDWDRLRSTSLFTSLIGGERVLETASVMYGLGPAASANPYELRPDNSVSTNKLPTLSARANAAPPVWTEGRTVPLSVDLAGTLRTTAGAGGGFTPYTRQAAWDGVYSFTLVDAPGVAAANRFLSLFNPAASLKTLIILEASVQSYSVTIAATKNSMRLTRITTATVGTLQAATEINKFISTDPNPTAEVRTANPTVTLGAEVDAFGPNENITAAASNSISRRTQTFQPEWGEFRMAAGEGLAFHQTIAGDVDQTWLLKLIWVEQ